MLMSSAVKLCVASCRSWALSPTHVLWNAQPRVVLVTSTTRRLRGHCLVERFKLTLKRQTDRRNIANFYCILNMRFRTRKFLLYVRQNY